MRSLCPLIVAALLSLSGFLSAATLEKLSLEEMAQLSTEIVRGTVVSGVVEARGAFLFSQFRVQVIERWKGPEASTVTVSVPGGSKAGIRQSFSGTPALEAGADYVFFLWTGKSGVTQIIGLSQGVFDVTLDAATGKPQASRAAIRETILDRATGRQVTDEGVRLGLDALRGQVQQALERRGSQ